MFWYPFFIVVCKGRLRGKKTRPYISLKDRLVGATSQKQMVFDNRPLGSVIKA
jgi:hypothetical protein